MFNLVPCSLPRLQPCGLVDIEVLESCATDYHISRRGEVDQPENIVRGGLMNRPMVGPKMRSYPTFALIGDFQRFFSLRLDRNPKILSF